MGTEIVFVFLTTSVLVVFQIWASGSSSLLTRYFWLDEIYTHTLVSDPSLAHAMKSLARGVETHPPGYYLLMRGLTALVGNSNEGTLRALALLFMLVALTGIYACLRLTFSGAASLASIVILWAHPLVISESFNARFYGPWLAALAWFSYGVSRSRHTRLRIAANLILALLAMLVCTLHYFGIVSLLLVIVGELWARRKLVEERWRGLPASAAGVLVGLAACLTFIMGQKAAMTVPSWLPATNLHAVGAFLDEVLFQGSIAFLAVAAWLATLRLALGTGQQERNLVEGDPTLQTGLSATLLLPFALILFSYLVQTVLVPRYSLPAVAGLAVVSSFLCSRLPPLWIVVFCGLLMPMSTWRIQDLAQAGRQEDAHVDYLINALRQDTDKEPVMFESPADLYVVGRYAPDLAARVYLIDFEAGEIGNSSPNRLFMRDLARNYEACYRWPPSRPWRELKDLPHFFLVPHLFAEAEAKGSKATEYPGFKIQRVDRFICQATRIQ
jgi:hypothetical protein